MGSPSAKLMRADAQRNHDAVLAAAKAVFAQAGTDAPMEDVARAAGVGKGTLYRRFPTREHLFAAILQDRVDELDASAQRALDAPDMWRALSEWLELYDPWATEFPGMSTQVGETLEDQKSDLGTAAVDGQRPAQGRRDGPDARTLPARRPGRPARVTAPTAFAPRPGRAPSGCQPALLAEPPPVCVKAERPPSATGRNRSCDE